MEEKARGRSPEPRHADERPSIEVLIHARAPRGSSRASISLRAASQSRRRRRPFFGSSRPSTYLLKATSREAASSVISPRPDSGTLSSKQTSFDTRPSIRASIRAISGKRVMRAYQPMIAEKKNVYSDHTVLAFNSVQGGRESLRRLQKGSPWVPA